MIASSLLNRVGAVIARTSLRSLAIGRTLPLLEKKTIAVPTMGDSITEGTIVEWSVQVGQAVQPDDVVCLVETDKVTVDIKATHTGVITKRFGEVDEIVEVGGNLYEIDTDAEATAQASSAAPTAASLSAEEPSVSPGEAEDSQKRETSQSTTTSKDEIEGRTPMIKFLGKEGWAQRKNGQGASTAATSPQIKETQGSSHVTTTFEADATMSHPMYGRPAFSEEEMEALIMGGASVAPRQVTHGTAATFK